MSNTCFRDLHFLHSASSAFQLRPGVLYRLRARLGVVNPSFSPRSVPMAQGYPLNIIPRKPPKSRTVYRWFNALARRLCIMRYIVCVRVCCGAFKSSVPAGQDSHEKAWLGITSLGARITARRSGFLPCLSAEKNPISLKITQSLSCYMQPNENYRVLLSVDGSSEAYGWMSLSVH